VTLPRSQHLILVFLAIASLVVNLLCLKEWGIRHGADTQRYLQGAENLLASHPLQDKQSSYLGYVAVVGVCRALAIGERGVVAFQIVVAALATLAVYELGRRLSGSLAGVLAAAFFVINVDLARWHVYLLTDSLYMSLVLLTTWMIARAPRSAMWWYVGAGLMVLFTGFVRPNGWLFVPIALIYWIAQTSMTRRLKWSAAVAVLLTFAGSLTFIGAFRNAIELERPDLSLREGVVVWNFPGWRRSMPPEPDMQAGLVGSIRYGARHPWATGRLAATRVAVELAHARPFYSAAHNAAILIILALVYPLVVLGFLRYRRQPLTLLIAAVIGSDLLVVAGTFADWDGRFLLHTFPLMGVLAACEATRWLVPDAVRT
jgi:4-amino-4-deoxy-L-arabinose transferase-like glycosyltransferase